MFLAFGNPMKHSHSFLKYYLNCCCLWFITTLIKDFTPGFSSSTFVNVCEHQLTSIGTHVIPNLDLRHHWWKDSGCIPRQNLLPPSVMVTSCASCMDQATVDKQVTARKACWFINTNANINLENRPKEIAHWWDKNRVSHKQLDYELEIRSRFLWD